MKDNKKQLWQALKFTLFSISAGVIQVGSLTLLEMLTDMPYWPCYLISLVLSVLWNFTLNRRFTFKSANNVPIAMAKVACFYLVFTPVSTWVGQVAESAGWQGNLVQILTMLANFVLEFLFFKFVVFREKKAED